jgi:transcriptional regulator with XRE-family HTH domain
MDASPTQKLGSATSAATSALSSALPTSLPSGADIGGFIKEQRETAKISLRRLAEEAGVSNPYLSQIERGLRRPSAEILQQLAKALRISAEQLYVQAGLLEDRGTSLAVESAIVSDTSITERQKRVLLDIYASFLSENSEPQEAPVAKKATKRAAKTAKRTAKKAAKKSTTATAKRTSKKAAKKSSSPSKAAAKSAQKTSTTTARSTH